MVIVDEISRTTMRPRVGWIIYNPALGRFLTEDTKGFNGGDPNLFRYVGNNSLGFIDPDGENPVSIACTALVGGVGLINTISDLAEINRILDEGEAIANLFARKADEIEGRITECTSNSEKRRLRELAAKFRQDSFDASREAVENAAEVAKNQLPGDFLQVSLSLTCNGVGGIIRKVVTGR